MAEEKEIVRAAVAVKRVNSQAADDSASLGDNGAKGESPKESKPKWKFAKMFGVCDVIRFKDGSTFQFRLIPSNTGGYAIGSSMVTEDSKLAANLREAAKNMALGLREI